MALLSQFSVKVLVHRAATILVHMKYRLNQQSKSWKAYVLAQTWWLGFMLVYRMQLLIEWFQIYFWLHLEKREKINPNIEPGLVLVVLGMNFNVVVNNCFYSQLIFWKISGIFDKFLILVVNCYFSHEYEN